MTRDPSSRRASAIGLSSSTRRPSGRQDALDRVAQGLLGLETDRGRLDPPAALDEDRARAVDHHLLDPLVGEQRLERPEPDRVADDQRRDLLAAPARERRRELVDERPHLARQVRAGPVAGPPALEQAGAKVGREAVGVSIERVDTR